jgi:hypothetical protein
LKNEKRDKGKVKEDLKNSREEYNRSDMTTILNINKNLKGG